MMNKETKIGLVLFVLVLIVSIAYFSYKTKVDPVDVPNEVKTPIVETPDAVFAQEILDALVLEGSKVLPEPENIHLIEVCIKVPADTEEKVREMAMVVVDRWLKKQKDTDIETIDLQVKANLEAIKEANSSE